MERGDVVVIVGCATAGNAVYETEEVTCGTSTKDGLSCSILTVSTHMRRSRVKYLSLHLRILYRPMYGHSRGKW